MSGTSGFVLYIALFSVFLHAYLLRILPPQGEPSGGLRLSRRLQTTLFVAAFAAFLTVAVNALVFAFGGGHAFGSTEEIVKEIVVVGLTGLWIYIQMKNVLETDWRGQVLLARVAGIEVREVATTWVGREIFITRGQLPPTAAGEVYWADLIGLAVVNRSGIELGEVVRLLETGAHDVLVVRGDRERLIPFVRGVHVVSIDLHARRVVVEWEADY